jgi:hypothetical protein
MLHDSYDLHTKTPRKDGTYPLKAKIYRSRTEYVHIALKIYLLPSQWDGKKIVNTLTAAVDNARLNNYRVSIGRVLLDIDESGENPVMSEIRARVEKSIGQKQQSPERFLSYYEDYTEKIKTKSTKASFLQSLSKIRKFDPSDKSFSQITPGWLRDFERYCENTGMSVNGINVYMRNIRTVYNRAIDDNIAQLNDYPFRRFKIRKESTPKRALTLDHLRRLRDYPCEPHQEMYRDLFMLIFYLIGINIVDLLHVNDIKNGRIEFRRSKTGRLYSIKVEPEAQAIIDKYRGKNYLLNVMDRYSDYKNFAHRMNLNLRSIGNVEISGRGGKKTVTPEFPGLTTYWARHGWATIAACLDIPKETIAAGLGHAGRTVTDVYITFDNKKVDDANRRVIDFVNG